MIACLDVDITPRTPDDQGSSNLYHVAQLLGAIARKNPRVETTLRLARSELSSALALTGIMFPRVCKAVVSTSSRSEGSTSDRSDSWTFFLGGRIFPDLRQLETNGFPRASTTRPLTLEEQLAAAEDAVAKSRHLRDTQTQSGVSFGGLRHLQTLKIEGDVTLNRPVVLSLLGSTDVPTHLSTLEIVYCPNILFTKNASTWSTLLQRSLATLPALRKLKLHIVEDPYPGPDLAHEMWQDTAKPHFCDIVRVFSQNIQHLDLALPFACRRMFLPPKPSSHYAYCEQRGAPHIQREPLVTLPQRLIDQGFKYRRLICWGEVCFDWHDWDAMAAHASAQGTEYSWEIVSDVENKASWHVGMHDAVHFKATDVIEQPY